MSCRVMTSTAVRVSSAVRATRLAVTTIGASSVSIASAGWESASSKAADKGLG
jgi:hypothetical protein